MTSKTRPPSSSLPPWNPDLPAAPNPGRPAKPSAVKPLPDGLKDAAYDGLFVGGDNRAYPRGTALESVPPMAPRNGKAKGSPLIQMNGVWVSKQAFSGQLQAMADATGRPVVGLYNASNGHVSDLTQLLNDRASKGQNPAVDAASELIYARAKAGQALNLSGHSQGALIWSRAFQDARARLTLEDGLSASEVDRLFSRFTLLTEGGAASTYDDAPLTVHVVNENDPSRLLTGSAFDEARVHPGRNSRTVTYKGDRLFAAHSLKSYVPHLPTKKTEEGSE